MELQQIPDYIGEKISIGTSYIIKFLGEQGINLSTISFANKLISIILLLGLFFLVIKFAEKLKPVIKWTLFILIVVLIICVGFSLFV